jgi:hypothetical protein
MLQKHCSDAQLLAYADGELPGRRTADKTSRHLQVCWQCRARLDEMVDQAHAVSRALSDDSFLHPLRTAEVKERLVAAQREYEGRLHASRISVRSRVSAGWYWAAAACACVGLLAAVAFWQGQTQKHEILAKSEQAEQVPFTQPVHQTLLVEISQTRPKPLRRTGKIEVWSQPTQKRFALRWWDAQGGSLRQALWRPQDDRQYVYRYTRSAGAEQSSAPGITVYSASPRKTVSLADLSQRGLEIGAIEQQFMGWLENRQWRPITLARDFAGFVSQDGVELNLERVSSAEGVRLLRLTARRRAGSLTTEITLEMDGTSYRPRLQRIRFETADQAAEVSLISERVETVPAAVLRSSVFTPDVAVTAPATRVVEALPLAPRPPAVTAIAAFTEAELSEKQIEVEYAVHRLNACLGGSVEVTRKGVSGIAITGLVADPERRDQIRAALSDYASAGWLTVNIRTVDEALSSGLAQQPGEHTDTSAENQPVRAGTIEAPKPPVEDLLVEYFRTHPEIQATDGSATNDPSKQAAHLASRTISLSQAALGEAWALRRLAQSFGGLSDLSLEPKRLLEAMIRAHLGALREQLDHQFELLAPVFPPALVQDSAADENPNLQWQDDMLSLFREIENLNDSTLELFAGTPSKTGSASVSERLAQRTNTLNRLRSATQAAEAIVEDQFSGSQKAAAQQQKKAPHAR